MFFVVTVSFHKFVKSIDYTEKVNCMFHFFFRTFKFSDCIFYDALPDWLDVGGGHVGRVCCELCRLYFVGVSRQEEQNVLTFNL